MAEHPYRPHEALRQFRQDIGVSQADMARASKMHPEALCAIETGAERLGVLRAIRIMEAYRNQLIAAGLGLEALIREQQ